MESFAISFLNYVISKKMIRVGKEFYIDELFAGIDAAGISEIKKTTRAPIGDSNWNNKENKDVIEKYILSLKVAEPHLGKYGTAIVLTEDRGEKLLDAGSVESYLDTLVKEKEIDDKRQQQQDEKLTKELKSLGRWWYPHAISLLAVAISALTLIKNEIRDRNHADEIIQLKTQSMPREDVIKLVQQTNNNFEHRLDSLWKTKQNKDTAK